MATLTRITPSGPGYATAAECKAAIIAEVSKQHGDAGGRPLPVTSNVAWSGTTALYALPAQITEIEAGYPLLPRISYAPSNPVDSGFLSRNSGFDSVVADGLPIMLELGGYFVTGDLCGYSTGSLGATLPQWDDYAEADTGEAVLSRTVTSAAPVTGLAGTYTRTTSSGITSITVTFASHGLTVGASVYLDFTSGAAVDGTYTVATVSTSGNSFTAITSTAADTSGTVVIGVAGSYSTVFSTGTLNSFGRVGRVLRFESMPSGWSPLNSGTYTLAAVWSSGSPTNYYFSARIDSSAFGSYSGGGVSYTRAYQMAPWGTATAWQELGIAHATNTYGTNPHIAWLQAQYPNPPRVIYWSNDEFQTSSGNDGAADWNRAHIDPRYRALYPDWATRTDAQKMTDLSDRLITQYDNFHTSFKSNLVAGWQDVTQHVGYGKGLTYNFKDCNTWPSWQYGGIHGADKEHHHWAFRTYDGCSFELYDNDWNSDVLAYKAIFSMQNEAMNARFARDIAESIFPNYWSEGICWDGRVGIYPSTGKGAVYTARGITYSPNYYKGWSQYCMWVLQPRQWRCFIDWLDNGYVEYWNVVRDQVAHVHSDVTLQRFWRTGMLVENPAVIASSSGSCTNITHPYAAQTRGTGWEYTSAYCGYPKNYHLTTSLDTAWGTGWTDCPRTSTEDTNHLRACWTLAYLLGTAPNREWLIYAHSTGISGATLTNVAVTIPGFDTVTLPEVPVEGAFYLLVEGSASQTARPDSDISSTGWIAVPPGSYYAVLDETTPSDTDYCYTISNGNTLEVALSDFANPVSSADAHTLRYRGIGSYTTYLVQGATVIASWYVNDADYVTYERALTADQIALITDYDDLRVRFVSGS